MKKIFIADVQWWNEFDEKDVTETVLVQANSFIDAMEQIENQYKDSLEEIHYFTCVGDGYVVHLGSREVNREEVDTVVSCITENNCF